jgi:hypothetical protein
MMSKTQEVGPSYYEKDYSRYPVAEVKCSIVKRSHVRDSGEESPGI